MAFMELPTELMQQIIPYTLPEGFESLALTCKLLYTLCSPFLEHHNNLRFHFRKFEYNKTNKDFREFRYHHELLRFPDTATSAYSLISRIAIEPVVAGYILEADFSLDSHIYDRIPPPLRERALHETWRDRGAAVRQLFANSLYLREAGLDWEEYYNMMMEDVNSWRRSEHAAAFLLTLLPNLEVLTPEFSEFRSPAPQKLITTILEIARRNPHGNVSLAQVNAYSGSCDIPWIPSLLALPRIKRFWGHGHMGKYVANNSNESGYLETDSKSTLEVAGFTDASADLAALTSFLKHAPCLKSLTFWHSIKPTKVTKIGIYADSSQQYSARSNPDLRGFERLKRLELPLGIVLCYLKASDPADSELLDPGSFLSLIVPASVSVLSLISPGKSPHDKALKLLFRDFANQKKVQTPNLKEISLTCPDDADVSYKAQCENLKAEAKRADVDLTLSEDPWLISTVGLNEDICFPTY
ncbi:hypothetical protein F1880_009211 [Penicillium rolfsii]|nr:hypothetical protein F1880_009211 [Penicillium rolfsii]